MFSSSIFFIEFFHHSSSVNHIEHVWSIKRKTRVILDIENYRAKREATLCGLADRMAKKVLKTGKSVKLEPMCANDRRIIHTALQNVEGVTTVSKGTEPNRYLVVMLERDAE